MQSTTTPSTTPGGNSPVSTVRELRGHMVPVGIASAAAAYLMFAFACNELDEEPDTVMADLIADLHLLADDLGIDWQRVEERAHTYHRNDTLDGAE